MQVVLAGLLLVDRVLAVLERQRRLAVRGLRMGQLPARRLAELAALVQLRFQNQLVQLEFHSQLARLGFQSRLEQLVGRILALLVLPVVQNRLAAGLLALGFPMGYFQSFFSFAEIGFPFILPGWSGLS